MPKLITLYAIRRDNITSESTGLGRRRLRRVARARKLARYLRRRFGVATVLHPWQVNAASIPASV